MEIIPAIWLALCLPACIPGAGQPADLHTEHLALFPPGKHCIRERNAAFHRWEYAKWRYFRAESNACPDAEHWRAVRERCFDAWIAWRELAECYHRNAAGDMRAKNDGYVCDQLRLIYNAVGPARFYAGQLPGPVDIREPGVEIVSLP